MFKTEDNNSDVKGRILLAAQELFIQQGYDKTSVRDIAAASETNVAMVNYYYRSKYALFEIIFERALDVLFNRIFSIFCSDKPIFELVELWIDSYYETLMEYPQIPIFILREISQNPQGLTQRILKREPLELYTRMHNRLEQEVEAGRIRPTPPLDFMLNVLSLSVFPFMFGQIGPRVADRPMADYHDVLKQHKVYVIDFVKQAIKP